MTGTQSLSFMQLQTIGEEVDRLEIAARRSTRWVEVDGKRIHVGQPVSIVIGQADRASRSLGAGRGFEHFNVPEASAGADKKVQIHRCYSNSYTFWIDRDGRIVHTFQPTDRDHGPSDA